MRLTKEYILRRVNRLLITFRVTWEELVDELDMAIEEINTYMSTKYPLVSKVLHDFSSPSDTYSYRAGGKDHYYFPLKYFNNIVIPFAAMQLLTIEEEFSELFNKYANQTQENLFYMARDEMSDIPSHLISAPQGVYFANPNPKFKQDPEGYFNREITVEDPKVKVNYSWGDINAGFNSEIKLFVDKPLPVDNNSYKPKSLFIPIKMTGSSVIDGSEIQSFHTHLVDYEGMIMGRFLGWSLIPNGEIVKDSIELGNEDITLYAIFDTDLIPVKYNGNGGTIHNWQPAYLKRENTEVIPFGGTAEKRGFKFLGWNPKSILVSAEVGSGGVDPNDLGPEEPIKFNANWTPRKYEINYVVPQEIYNPNSRNYFFGKSVELESLIVNDGTFIGWFDNPSYEGFPIKNIGEDETGNKTLYAHIIYDHVTIRFYDIFNRLTFERRQQIGLQLPKRIVRVESEIEINGLIYMPSNLAWKIKNTNKIIDENYVVRESIDVVPYFEKHKIPITLIFQDPITKKIKSIESQKGITLEYKDLITEAIKLLDLSDSIYVTKLIINDDSTEEHITEGLYTGKETRFLSNALLIFQYVETEKVIKIAVDQQSDEYIFRDFNFPKKEYISQDEISSKIRNILPINILKSSNNPNDILIGFYKNLEEDAELDEIPLNIGDQILPAYKNIDQIKLVENRKLFSRYWTRILVPNIPTNEKNSYITDHIWLPKNSEDYIPSAIGSSFSNTISEKEIDYFDMFLSPELDDTSFWNDINNVKRLRNAFNKYQYISKFHEESINPNITTVFPYPVLKNKNIFRLEYYLLEELVHSESLEDIYPFSFNGQNKIFLKQINDFRNLNRSINEIRLLDLDLPKIIEKTGEVHRLSLTLELLQHMLLSGGTLKLKLNIDESLSYSLTPIVEYLTPSPISELPTIFKNQLRSNIEKYFNKNFSNLERPTTNQQVQLFLNQADFKEIATGNNQRVFGQGNEKFEIELNSINYRNTMILDVPAQSNGEVKIRLLINSRRI